MADWKFKKKDFLFYFLLSVAFCAAVFSHFYNLGLGEFDGEDEALILNTAVKTLHGVYNVKNFGHLFLAPNPPVRIIVTIPFILILGATEFAVRFPNAIAGILMFILIYKITILLFSRKVALIACLLYAFSGIAAINKSANGAAIFSLFFLLSFYYLMKFVDSESEKSEGRNLLKCAVSLGLSTLTFVESLCFVPPIIYVIYRKKKFKLSKKLLFAPAVYLSFIVLYILGWFALPLMSAKLGITKSMAGNSSYIFQRLSNIGAFNFFESIKYYIGHNSILYVAFLFITIPIALFSKLEKKQRYLIIFFLPHYIIWLFIIKPSAGHTLYEFSLFSILSAFGFYQLYNSIANKKTALFRFARFAVIIIFGIILISAFWHNYVLFSQDKIQPTLRNLVFFHKNWSKIGNGAPKFVRTGKAAAGVYVRENSEAEESILTNFGGNMTLYYAARDNRPNQHLNDIGDQLLDFSYMKKMGLRFLLINADYPFNEQVVTKLNLAAVIKVQDKPKLFIYDLWNETLYKQLLDADSYRRIFYKKYRKWNRLIDSEKL